MKKNKKMIMAVSFCLGVIILVTTALAEIASKSGYEQFKDAIKLTAENFSEKLDSYTLETIVTIKDNDKLVTSNSMLQKYNRVDGIMENSTTIEYSNGETKTNYNYSDKGGTIFHHSDNDIYYVNEFPRGDYTSANFSNPFKEDRAKDVERIFDALVGNLKDYVVVEDNTDGTKEFSGSLSEAQIPPLVNAVSSFAFKQTFSNRGYMDARLALPDISEDVFVKKVTGKASINKEGIMQSMFATAIVSGKDKSGNTHDLTFEALVRVTDINSTNIVKPDLRDKKVEISTNYPSNDTVLPKKFIGTYKNDIVIEKDDKYVKIGERLVDITKIEGNNVTGRYYEQYKDEYAEYKEQTNEFTFDVQIRHLDGVFEIVNSEGIKETGSIYFDTMTGKLNLHLNSMFGRGKMFDSSFSRVFDN